MKPERENLLTTAEYWAEELMSPLCLLTYPKTWRLQQDLLTIYDGHSRQRFYYLNQRHQRDSLAGYRYFRQPGNLDRYLLKTSALNDQLTTYQSRRALGDATFGQLHHELDRALTTYTAYITAYIKTEAYRLERFAARADHTTTRMLEQLGQRRLQLRQAAEQFYIQHLEPLLTTIAHRAAIRPNDILFYTYTEVVATLTDQSPADEITARQSGYFLRYTNNHPSIETGRTYREVKNFLATLNHQDATEIHGRVAQPGQVRGRVKLILHTQRYQPSTLRLPPNTIIVTEMTRPSILTLCRSAAAIVTDEGGLASHAAIIAREWNIPTIIGTKVATTLLQDGDLVEVDAVVGIVRLLERGTHGG